MVEDTQPDRLGTVFRALHNCLNMAEEIARDDPSSIDGIGRSIVIMEGVRATVKSLQTQLMEIVHEGLEK